MSLLILILSPAWALAAPPSWINSPTRMTGKKITVTCFSTGADSSTAKISALNQCRAVAAEYLTQKINVQNTSIETEKDVASFSSVSSNSDISNLNCKPIKEQIETAGSQVTSYLQCQFNLNKTKVKATAEPNESSADQRLQSLDEASTYSQLPEDPNYVLSDRRSITISVVPSCTSLMIEGAEPRIVPCNSNPVTFIVSPADKKIIVRAINHIAKTILISDIYESKRETFNVVLEGK